MGIGAAILRIVFGRETEPTPAVSQPMARIDEPSDRDLELAALNNLSLPFFSQWFPKSDSALDAGQRWVDDKQKWVETIEDPRIRKAYAGWIDYVQCRLNENREENKHHIERIARENRQEEYSAERARAAALARQLPKPR